MSRFEDPDARSYLDAVEAADGQGLEAGVREAVDKFVKGCKADGIWPAIKSSCILAGARTLNGALVPLVGTAPTNYNFVGADYNRETGLKGNASNKYLDSNRNNNADPQDSQHLAVYLTDIGAGGQRILGGGGGSPGASVLGFNSGRFQCRSRNGTLTNFDVITFSTTFYGKSRNNSSNYEYRYFGTTKVQTQASQTSANDNIEVFRSQAYPFGGRISFYSIGESLDLANLDSRISTLMTDLAAAIP